MDKPSYPLTYEKWARWTSALLDALSRANDDRASIKAWAITIQKGE